MRFPLPERVYHEAPGGLHTFVKMQISTVLAAGIC
ncbi:MAG: hypothetical protein ACI9TH_002583 [Kiritimatiellia bacterium]|jgi:hypothetical protein